MKRMLGLGGVLALLCMASPVVAGDFAPADATCYWCIRDAIFSNVALINHLEANPDIDEGMKGPQIVAARADIQRLRRLLGPVQDVRIEPCCYARPPLHIR